MTRITSKMIYTFSILTIILLLVSTFYIQNSMASLDTSILENIARKEDLASKQDYLKTRIDELNRSLQDQFDLEKSLSKQVVDLKKGNNSVSTTITTTKTTSSSSGGSSSSSGSGSATQPPAITPSPSPSPVTKAS